MTLATKLAMGVMALSAVAGTVLRLADPAAHIAPFTMLTIGAAVWMAIELATMGDR